MNHFKHLLLQHKENHEDIVDDMETFLAGMIITAPVSFPAMIIILLKLPASCLMWNTK